MGPRGEALAVAPLAVGEEAVEDGDLPPQAEHPPPVGDLGRRGPLEGGVLNGVFGLTQPSDNFGGRE